MGTSRAPLVLVSGFGPFEEVDPNPSGALARALAKEPPPGWRVRSAVLPVSFARAPARLEALLRSRERPALCLSLGVAKRRGFRLERYGGPRLKDVPRVDVDGRSAREFSHAGARLETVVELRALLAALRRRGVDEVRISHTAGGYVCEHVYHHLLARAAERGVPGLFVHVPPLRFTALERQLEVLHAILAELASDRTRRTPRYSPASASRG